MPVTVSIIVPVYNGASVLENCVESILSQSMQDFELILVNDGSKDSTLDICRNFEQKDSRVKVIDKSNGGVSSARNMGLDVATGKYVMFVDADDELYPNSLAVICGYNEDVLVCGYETFGDDNFVDLPEDAIYEDRDVEKYISKNIGNCNLRTPWAKMIKRTIIEENNLRFDSTLRVAEDYLFNTLLYKYTPALRTLPILGYRYRSDAAIIRKYNLNAEYTLLVLRTVVGKLQSYGYALDSEVCKYIRSNIYTFFKGALYSRDFSDGVSQVLTFIKKGGWKWIPYDRKIRKMKALIGLLSIPIIYRIK